MPCNRKEEQGKAGRSALLLCVAATPGASGPRSTARAPPEALGGALPRGT